MKTPKLLITALLALASANALAQAGEKQAQTAPSREPDATVLAPVLVEQPRARRDDAFSPFVWASIGATGTIRTDIVRAWFASDKPEPVRTAEATSAPR